MKKRLSILFFLLCVSLTINAQTQNSMASRVKAILKYTGVEASSDTITDWIRTLSVAESTDQPVPKRNAAWKKFLVSFYQHQGTIPDQTINLPTLEAWSQLMTFPFLFGRVYDIQAHQHSRTYPKIVNRSGSGPKNILLIPPQGFSSKAFEVFKKRHAAEFTFYEVNFPSGANAPSFPDYANYSEASWLKQAEQAIENIIADIDELYVMAMGSGLYTAVRLAKSNPEKIKGIIGIDGNLKNRLIDRSTGKNADLTYRKKAVNRTFPIALFVQFSPGVVANNYALTKNQQLNQRYLNEIGPEKVNEILRYSLEYRAQDIYTQLKEFKTPVLNLIAIQDDQSPTYALGSPLGAWQEFKTLFPELPFSNIKIPDSRTLSFIDQPELFDYYFNRFVNDPDGSHKPITPRAAFTLEQASPAASVSQLVASTEVEIQYSRPALRGRKAFGHDLVPWNQVWRAGANQATTFTVSNDVLINGAPLPAGRYSLFMVPSEAKWEIIFNQVADQWGSFKYNPEFDALRIEVTPSLTNLKEEHLSFDFTGLKDDQAKISMQWENTQVKFEVKEDFRLPKAPEDTDNWAWKELLTDAEGDVANQGMTDGKQLSYLQKGDSLWFKFDLYSFENQKAFALNLLLDTDNDQSTGMPWFGQNTSFVFDKALTLWMRKSRTEFQGLHGMMNPSDFTTGSTDLEIKDNIAYYLDPDKKRYVIRVHKDDLGAKSGKLKLIGAVGEFQTWNDDIGDNEAATIQIKQP